VAEANICGMYVEYEEKFDIKGTSGAPVLNHKDEVVGIHVGQARTRDGRMLAMANPISSIHTHLHLALEKE
jgi:V8-like Glu-specific endopeptidase